MPGHPYSCLRPSSTSSELASGSVSTLSDNISPYAGIQQQGQVPESEKWQLQGVQGALT